MDLCVLRISGEVAHVPAEYDVCLLFGSKSLVQTRTPATQTTPPNRGATTYRKGEANKALQYVQEHGGWKTLSEAQVKTKLTLVAPKKVNGIETYRPNDCKCTANCTLKTRRFM